eukprot:4456633-Amphidinium_carterae.1
MDIFDMARSIGIQSSISAWSTGIKLFLRDDHLLAPHNNTGGEVRQLDSSPALDLEDALPEASEMESLDAVPGGPVDPLEEQEPGSP